MVIEELHGSARPSSFC